MRDASLSRSARRRAKAANDAAKDFPSRSIKIVVPFPAGGPSDVLARLIGQKMTEDWGQPVVIENRVGANTVIGAQVVKQAPADGYTLLMAIDSTLTMNQYLYRTPPYDPINDFVPITLVAKTMILLMVNSASEVKTMQRPDRQGQGPAGKLNFGAGTITTQADRLPVQQSRRHQYRAGALQRQRRGHPGPADQERRFHLRRHLGRGIADPERAVPRAGEVRRPAVPAGAGRADGADGRSQPRSDHGLARARRAEGHAARDRRQSSSSEVAKVLADPAIKAKADAAGLFPAASTPAEFAAFIKAEADRWSKVVAETGMKYD